MILFASPSDRFRLRIVRASTMIAAAVMTLAAVSIVGGSARPAFAAPILRGEVGFGSNGGVPVTSGGSGPFNITLPADAACQGGGASGYRWETYLVSASVDVGALTFGSGPNPVPGAFVSALFDTFSEQVSQKAPAPSPLGKISGIPLMSLEATTVDLPVGEYKIGIACTFNNGLEVQDYWMTTIAVTSNPSDAPLGIAWTIATPPPPDTTTTTTTIVATSTTAVATSTTTAGSTTIVESTSTTDSTSTTSPGSTSTSVAVSTTTGPLSPTTTSRPGSAPTPIQAASPSPSIGTLAETGWSPYPVVIWAILLLVFGRIAILLRRPLKVRPYENP